MSITTTNLLRRTIVGLGAALALGAGAQALAQGTVTLSGTTGNTCSYSQMTVTPNGNIAVTCGTTSTPQLANFALSHASQASGYVLSPNTSTSATVTRTGGPSEAQMVMYNVSGTGCSTSSGGIMLLAGQSQTIPFTIGAAGTNCTVSIALVTGTSGSVSPNTITFSSGTSGGGGGGGGGGGVPAGCPAMPSNSVAGSTAVNDFQSVQNLYGLASGAIVYWTVPASPNAASVKVGFSQGQTARTPASPVIEYQVSKCPGVFLDTGVASQCTYRSTQINQNEMTIWTASAYDAAGKLISQQSDLTNPNICFAAIASEAKYINVRTSYASCPYPDGCGFSYRWNQFGSNSQF